MSISEASITCGRMEGGKLRYGILKETGMDDKKPKAQELRAKAEQMMKEAEQLEAA